MYVLVKNPCFIYVLNYVFFMLDDTLFHVWYSELYDISCEIAQCEVKKLCSASC